MIDFISIAFSKKKSFFIFIGFFFLIIGPCFLFFNMIYLGWLGLSCDIWTSSCSMWDLVPLHWLHGILATGHPGKYLCLQICLEKWSKNKAIKNLRKKKRKKSSVVLNSLLLLVYLQWPWLCLTCPFYSASQAGWSGRRCE